MGRYPTGPTACIEDPTCRVRIMSMRDVGPIVIFSFWSLVILNCSAFLLWKWSRLNRQPVKPTIVQESNLSGLSETEFSSQSKGRYCYLISSVPDFSLCPGNDRNKLRRACCRKNVTMKVCSGTTMDNEVDALIL